MALFNIIPYNTKLDVVGKRFITFALCAVITALSLGSYFTKGLNFGIDFKGGYIFEVHMPTVPDVPALREKLSSLHLGDVSLQEFGDKQNLLIRVERQAEESKEAASVSSSDQEASSQAIKQALGEGVEYRRIETVGPKVGSELIQNALYAIFYAISAMLIYIAFRFEWQFAVCAVAALLHDCVAIMSLFTLFSLEFNETSIIAILITAGYSINDTIVIFDRIRENLSKFKKLSIKEVINKSLNETFSRTMLTATTTLIALFCLYLFGGQVISSFSLPILFGIMIGSFSSIFLAAPLLIYLHKDIKGQEAVTAA
ncbi:MAG TPA: protein translocase subunit SecF [Alphaproteobacteria bacterium]|nr:protein translocase subunit SecF [Alphaproteobacteria bacterium]